MATTETGSGFDGGFWDTNMASSGNGEESQVGISKATHLPEKNDTERSANVYKPLVFNPFL